MAAIPVTGAGRGIGLEFFRQHAARGGLCGRIAEPSPETSECNFDYRGKKFRGE